MGLDSPLFTVDNFADYSVVRWVEAPRHNVCAGLEGALGNFLTTVSSG